MVNQLELFRKLCVAAIEKIFKKIKSIFGPLPIVMDTILDI